MRIFKQSYGKKGQQKKTASWYVELRDHNDIRRKIPAFKDKKASLEFGNKLEKLVACRVINEKPEGDLLSWIESLSSKLTKKLIDYGILNLKIANINKTLLDHINDYEQSMHSKGNGKQHVHEETNKIKRIINHCEFIYWTNVTASNTQQYLAKLKDEGASIRTQNGYLGAFKAFCNWMVLDKRATESPIHYLRKLNEKTDVRRKRRALTNLEIQRLLSATYNGPVIRGIPPHERVLLYLLALETGLRWSESFHLTRDSFELSDKQAAVTVEASYSKNKREDSLPLRRSTAVKFKEYFQSNSMLPNAKAFPHMPNSKVGSKILKVDLESAGISFEDSSGSVCDYHSLRHTFISGLARKNVHPSIARVLARHSDVNLTLTRYTHVILEDKIEAIDKLPEFDFTNERQAAQATGTDDKNLVHILSKQMLSDKIDEDRSGQINDNDLQPSSYLNASETTLEAQNTTHAPLAQLAEQLTLNQSSVNRNPIENQLVTYCSDKTLSLSLSKIREIDPKLASLIKAWCTLSDPIKAKILDLLSQ